MLDFNVVYFGLMIAGYLLGIYFGRSAKSISYLLFLVSLYLVFALFKITKGFYSINKWGALADNGYLNNVTADILIYSAAFLLGFAVSYLLCMRIMHLSVSRLVKLILMVPVVNVLALFLRVPKVVAPNFQITKLNVTTLLVVTVGSFLVQPEIDKGIVAAEMKYFEKLQQANNNTAERIVEIYKKNKGFPYIYDDGYLNVFELEANNQIVEFKMKETQQDIFDWDSTDLNTWLLAELCHQQTVINDNISEVIDVFVKFEVFDFAGQLRWDGNTNIESC